MIDAAQATIDSGRTITIDDLITLARETSMPDESKNTVAWRRYEQNRPRTEVDVDPATYADYVGAYRLENGPFYFVTTRDGRLYTRVSGQADLEIVPEAADQFFMKALPVQVTFVRDAAGKVDHLVHHQHGEETSGRRVDDEEAGAAEAALRDRVRNKIPQPGSEAIIRRVIDEHLRGEVDFDAMSPPLAALARQQYDAIQAGLKDSGALIDLKFMGVNPEGWDVYVAQFEDAKIEWAFILAADGKISGLYLRPAL